MDRRKSAHFLLMAAILATGKVFAANDAPSIMGRPDAFFSTEEGKKVVDNIVGWQGHGPRTVMAWPKAYDATIPRPSDGSKNARGDKLEWGGIATIDNGATYSEMHILGRAIAAEAAGARREMWESSFYKGLDAIASSQYENGGWPQRWPPGNAGQAPYDKHITFNDNAMTRLMVELKLIAAGDVPYGFVDSDHRKKAQAAFDKGVECILKCQIVVDGKLTGWCAQHDEVTFKPAQGRAYELPSISGQEGAEIAVLLMKLEHPDARVKKAIKDAVTWFDAVKIVNKKSVSVMDAAGKKDRVLEDEPGATVWARFYDVETGRPLFSGRDSAPKQSMSEIEIERRTGYSWYGNWGQKVAKEYIAWKKRNGS